MTFGISRLNRAGTVGAPDARVIKRVPIGEREREGVAERVVWECHGALFSSLHFQPSLLECSTVCSFG